MCSEQSFSYLIQVCNSIKEKHKELDGLYFYYLVEHRDRKFLLEEKTFYNQIAMTFLHNLRDGLLDEDYSNLANIEYLLHKIFLSIIASDQDLTKDERDNLKLSLTVFSDTFHQKFINTLKFYDIEAELPSHSTRDEMLYFCKIRIDLINNVLSGRSEESFLSEIGVKLSKMLDDCNSPLNALMKNDVKTLLLSEDLRGLLSLVNNVFSS